MRLNYDPVQHVVQLRPSMVRLINWVDRKVYCGNKRHKKAIFNLLFSHKVLSLCDPHGLQHARLPCPSPSPRVCSNSRPLSWRCHPTISSSVSCSFFWGPHEVDYMSLLCPGDFPGKNTGVGCPALLQGIFLDWTWVFCFSGGFFTFWARDFQLQKSWNNCINSRQRRPQASLVAQMVKNPPAMRETWLRSLGWKISIQSVGSQRVRHDWVTATSRSMRMDIS